MICPNCQKEIIDDAMFCAYCGNKIAETNKNVEPVESNESVEIVSEKKPEPTKICKVCGKEIPESAICCPICGKFAGGIKKETPTPIRYVAKPEPLAKDKKHCKVCKQIIPKSSIYCPICGKMSDIDNWNFSTKEQPNGIAIAGFVISFFVPILGLIFGIIGLKRTKKGAGRLGLARAAIIISAISMALTLLSYVIVLSQLGSLLTYY